MVTCTAAGQRYGFMNASNLHSLVCTGVLVLGCRAWRGGRGLLTLAGARPEAFV